MKLDDMMRDIMHVSESETAQLQQRVKKSEIDNFLLKRRIALLNSKVGQLESCVRKPVN